MIPSAPTWPACVLCGNTVEPGQQFCPICIDKPRNVAPVATIDTRPQPEPPYHRTGAFRRPDAAKDDA